MNRPLSFSSLSLFQTCRYRWYRTYITEDVPEDDSPWLKIGSAVHGALEQWRLNGGDRRKLYEYALQYDLPQDKYILNEVRTILHGINLPRVRVGILLGVEVRIEVEFDGFSVVGIIDKLERLENKLVVTDYKTNRKIETRKYLQQLATYDILIQRTLPLEGLEVYYELFFVRYNRVVPFRVSEEYRREVLSRYARLAEYITEHREDSNAWPKLQQNGPDCRWCPLKKECWE